MFAFPNQPMRAIAIVGLLLCSTPEILSAQITEEIKKVGTFKGKGTVVDIQPGEITIARADGKEKSFIIQDKGDRAISLDGNDYIVSMPSKIKVYGQLPSNLLERGMLIDFKSKMNKFGKPGEPIKEITIAKGDASALQLELLSSPNADEFVDCHVVGRVVTARRGKAFMEVPKSRLAPQQRITFQLAPDSTFDLEVDNLTRVQPGDTVETFAGQEMSNGAFVIREIKIKMTAERKQATVSFSDQLFQKYGNLSDEPGVPRTEESDFFVLHTDLSPRSSKVLLAKLDTMFRLLKKYYAEYPRKRIECYVVRDLQNFPGKLHQMGASKIAEGAGVTLSQGYTLMRGNRAVGDETISVVYSCEDHGVVQHESVHAYCSMAFGGAGPIWYAEGMAEVGQYWQPGELAVKVDAVVIEYLTAAEKKKLKDIVAAGQITGDSWKAYAWRWALCHLLMHNPNYQKRFKQLGKNIMSEKKKDSFNIAFGDVAKEISFEYDQFVKNFDNGYRVDLCAWDWQTEAPELTSKPVKATVRAQNGWQAVPGSIVKGQSYEVLSKGKWKTRTDGVELTADGSTSGRGKLIGAVLSDDYELSPPFDLGAKRKFRSGYSGKLYVRCKDTWSQLDDNSGELTVYIRKAKK